MFDRQEEGREIKHKFAHRISLFARWLSSWGNWPIGRARLWKKRACRVPCEILSIGERREGL